MKQPGTITLGLEQNVIGDGGWRSDGGGFTVLGTMGQANAGSTTAGGQFHLRDVQRDAGRARPHMSGDVVQTSLQRKWPLIRVELSTVFK